MFATETLHCRIWYQEIESLFGEATAGKLPGMITSISGSHRRICIQHNKVDSIGFFDEFYVDDDPIESLNNALTVGEVEKKLKVMSLWEASFKRIKVGKTVVGCPGSLSWQSHCKFSKSQGE